MIQNLELDQIVSSVRSSWWRTWSVLSSFRVTSSATIQFMTALLHATCGIIGGSSYLKKSTLRTVFVYHVALDE